MNKNDRKNFKAWAKNSMHKNYWKSVFASLIFLGLTFFFLYFLTYGISLLMGCGVGFGFGMLAAYLEGGLADEEVIIILFMMAVFLVISAVFTIIGAVGKFFIANPLELGCKKYFTNGLYNPQTKFGEVGTAFGNSYKNIAKVLCIRDIYLGLWYTLAMTIYMIIGTPVLYGGMFMLGAFDEATPNIGAILGMFLLIALVYVIFFASFTPVYIMSLHYLFIPYILADNPDMPRKQVFALSKQMIQGNKKSVFVMHLSFMGWLILGACTCGILHILYVGPYMEYTTAAYYKALQQRHQALNYGQNSSPTV